MKELTVAAEIKNLSTVTAFVDAELERAGCPKKKQFQIDVVIDEIFSNICLHAYAHESGSATVQFEILEDENTASITFVDSGKPFNPLTTEDPDVSLALSDRRIGGLGIFMVKKTMDSVQYEFLHGQNRLNIRKKL